MKTDILVLANTAEIIKMLSDTLVKQFNATDNKEVKEFLNSFTPDLIAADLKLSDFLKTFGR